MSYIPDARTNEIYNYENLTKEDKDYVDGYDWCVNNSVSTFFDNLEIYFEDMELDDCDLNIARFLEKRPNVREAFKECLLHYIEMGRDELITSMIDNYEDDEE